MFSGGSVKENVEEIKINVEAGKASIAAFGNKANEFKALNIDVNEVVKKINEATKLYEGFNVDVTVFLNKDKKDFSIKIDQPPISELLKKKANIEKGHGKAWSEGAIGDIKLEEIIKIAKYSQETLSTDVKENVKQLLGTALSIGLTVNGENPKKIIKLIDEGKITV